MSDYFIVSICRRNPIGEIDLNGHKVSIVEKPNNPYRLDFLQADIPEKCIEDLKYLKAFKCEENSICLEKLNGISLTNAIDILADAICELHKKYKIWNQADPIVFETRKSLEKLIEVCHDAANCFVSESNKHDNKGNFIGFELFVKKALI